MSAAADEEMEKNNNNEMCAQEGGDDADSDYSSSSDLGMTSQELRKEVRRLKHARRGQTGPFPEVEAMERRYVSKKELERREMELKGAITLARKALRGGGEDAALEEGKKREELAELERRYSELTGKEKYSKKRKRREKERQERKEAAKSLGLLPGPDASTFEKWEERDFFKFEVVHESKISRARVCRVRTPHGVIETPNFVPVATNGALKAVESSQAEDVQLMFCNTYHLLVHPGADVVEDAGGIHAFANRKGPIITDSGGFQVFSLADDDENEDGPELKSKRTKRIYNNNNKDAGDSDDSSKKQGGSLLSVDERGTTFRSYLDGSVIELTPESSVLAQKKIGADIIIPLDELPPYHVTDERLALSVALSHRWMARSLRTHLADKRKQAMYAVVHGGVNRELRSLSVDYLSSLPFDGMAIGGSLGKDKAEMIDLLTFLMPKVPRNKPNHLLGIADPESALAVVPLGVDTMDSCNPTRVARHGTLFTTDGTIKIKQTKYARDYSPVDPKLPEDSIPGYTRAYLHHLFKQNEVLAFTLASIHNIKFMNHLMADMRRKIMNDEL